MRSTISLGTSASFNEQEVDLSHFSTPHEVLGIGGFGLVRKVVKISGWDAGSIYAAKTTSKASILARSTGLQAMATELKTLILLEGCEHICHLHYAFQDSQHLYYILDYAIGGDMRYNMRRCSHFRFPEALAKLFIKQVLLALQHCHTRSILHRDIKPENILLHADGKVSLSDFGVAKLLPDIENCRSTSGTHGYMAPEVYSKEHVHGSAFDWFATGITLFELLTGRRPFEAARIQRYASGRSTAPTGPCGCYEDDDLSVEDLRQAVGVSEDCQSFLDGLLHPLATERLGARGAFQQIIDHPWMAISLQPYPLHEVCRHLPHFEGARTMHEQHPIMQSKEVVFSKINMSHSEAVVAVRQHLQAATIAEESQPLFQQ